jgi:hypothetical protein
MADPVSTCAVDAVFEGRVRELNAQALAAHAGLAAGTPVPWYRPGGWDGDHDLEALGRPFDRSKVNQQAIDAMKDAEHPGVTGDVQAATTQVAYLANLERAWRARVTQRRPRAVAHAAGRFLGHGGAGGPYILSALEYVRVLVREAKESPGNVGGD